MPPSIDSMCTQSACVTLSTPRKRNSKVRAEEDIKKQKPRGLSTSLSETSPHRRSDKLDITGQLTQESQKNQPSPDMDPFVHVDQRPERRQHQECVSMAQNGFLKRPKLGKESEKRRVSQDVDGPVKSMILHSAGLARTILAAYEKERDQANRQGSAMMTELAQLRTFSEAAAAELPLLRAFREAATVELARLRISNEAAEEEVTNLQMENAELVTKEASASSKLDALQRQWATGEAVNIVAAFVMSKALMLREVDLNETGSSEIGQLRFKNGQMSKEIAEMNDSWRSQMLRLQSSLAVAERELLEVRAVKAELMKEKLDRDSSACSAANELLVRLAAANKEVQLLHAKVEALVREKEAAAEAATRAAAMEREKMESHSETLLREMQTAIETTGREMEKMHSTIESKTATLRELFLEKEDIVREKAKSDARVKMKIAEILSEKAELVAEKEKASATAAREFEKLSSCLEATLENLQTLRRETGMEKVNLESEMAAKNLELEGLKKKLVDRHADMAARNARGAEEIYRLKREGEQGRAREAALLEKLRSMSAVPSRAHSQMHLAFLINCGLLRAEEHGFGFMPEQGCP